MERGRRERERERQRQRERGSGVGGGEGLPAEVGDSLEGDACSHSLHAPGPVRGVVPESVAPMPPKFTMLHSAIAPLRLAERGAMNFDLPLCVFLLCVCGCACVCVSLSVSVSACGSAYGR